MHNANYAVKQKYALCKSKGRRKSRLDSEIGPWFDENITRTLRTSTMLTCYVVQSFKAGHKGFLIPEEPLEARSEEHARTWAERLAVDRAGVVAFSRTGDAALGVYDDAKVICQFGLVPELALQMVS